MLIFILIILCLFLYITVTTVTLNIKTLNSIMNKGFKCGDSWGDSIGDSGVFMATKCKNYSGHSNMPSSFV